MSKKILVTGGAGFIGSHFVDLAIDKGYEVVVLDKLSYAGNKENLTEALGTGKAQLVEGDICDTELVKSLLNEHGFCGVINFAAESHVDRSIDDPGVFIQTNIVGAYNLLNCSEHYWSGLDSTAQTQFRFLQVSTDEVYGSLGEEGKFTEQNPYKPNSPYSASKAAADHLTRAWYKTFNLPVIVTNCSNNYGPRQYPEKLIPVMIKNALEGKSLPVYGTGKNVRDWIYVIDHCSGILQAFEKGRPGGTYCFGGDAEFTNNAIVDSICGILDEISPKESGNYIEQKTFVEDRKGHDLRYAIDDSLAQEELGFTRSKTFESGLKETVEWYLEQFRP